MNWAKVKNILILIFLILNVILGYMNYQKKVEAYTLTKQQESNIKKLLYNHNIMVYTLLPQKYPPMKKLLLTPESSNDEEQVKFLKVFLEETEDLRISIENNEQNERQIVYAKGDQKIGFSTGHIFYRADLHSKSPITYKKEEAKDLIDKLLVKLGYSLSKLEWNFKDEGNGNYKFFYYETYKGNLVYNNYIEFSVRPGGIDKVDIYRMKPEKYTELSRSIYAPDEMLFGFMNQIRKIEDSEEILVIQRIDLGYLIGSEGPWLKEEEGIPYYRITLSDGRHFYMNAYTNEIQ